MQCISQPLGLNLVERERSSFRPLLQCDCVQVTCGQPCIVQLVPDTFMLVPEVGLVPHNNGHSQVVPDWANVNGRIGGKGDRVPIQQGPSFRSPGNEVIYINYPSGALGAGRSSRRSCGTAGAPCSSPELSLSSAAAPEPKTSSSETEPATGGDQS